MPSISQGLPLYLSTAANIGTRVKGPAHAGQVFDGGTAGGPIPSPGGYICVQSTASITNQIVSTSSVGIQNASFVYIPVSTGSFVSSNAAGQAPAPPFLGVGTPIVWNDAAARLMIWSSGAASWLSAPAAQAFTCSS